MLPHTRSTRWQGLARTSEEEDEQPLLIELDENELGDGHGHGHGRTDTPPPRYQSPTHPHRIPRAHRYPRPLITDLNVPRHASPLLSALADPDTLPSPVTSPPRRPRPRIVRAALLIGELLMLLIAVLSSLVLASLLSWGAFEALRLAFHLGPQLLADAWRFALASPEKALIALVAIPAGGAFVTLLTLAAILSVLGAGKFAFIAATQIARTRWEHFLAPE